MIASDYSSDDSMSSSSSTPELAPRSNKPKQDSSTGGNNKDSPLKRAIKENENSIIQSILSPPPHVSLPATNSRSGNKNSNSESTGDKKTTSTTTVSEGLSPLLDYLFEDGQLTRIEYDIVDKGYGINSAAEQVQVLLRILIEQKDDGALEILLQCVNRLDPTSETVRRLCSHFLPTTQENPVVFRSEMYSEEGEGAEKVASSAAKKAIRQPLLEKFPSLAGNGGGSRKLHDFYYGTRQMHHLHDPSSGSTNDHDDSNNNGNTDVSSFNERKWGTQQQQMNKTRELDPTDFRDFYLTNGCLETIRNLILDNCKESITACGWEKVLRNMNGLLSTDVLSIKDLLFQIKTLDHQRAMETEIRVAKVVRKIHRERRKLRQSSPLEKQKRENNSEIGGEGEDDEALSKNDNRVGKERKMRNERENKQEAGSSVDWNQIIYHSLQVWKQRNGFNSTFYSLIGIFQHSNLYQTADLLLASKKEIQLRENEKDITQGNAATDVNNGIRTSTTSTMLEKSDFLRKFYTPSKRNENGNNGNLKAVGLLTTKDRVSVSPVLSLDLL